MHAHDIATALALSSPTPPSTFMELGRSIGISPSQAHAAVARLKSARLIDRARRVDRPDLVDFLRSVLPRLFPATPGARTTGVLTGPTRHGEGPRWVWPTPEGTAEGQAIEPLYRALPDAVKANEWMLGALALVDALRVFNPREADAVGLLFAAHLAPRAGRPRADLAAPDALEQVFSAERLDLSLQKTLNDPRWARRGITPLVGHILTRPILACLGGALLKSTRTEVISGSFRPSGSDVLVVSKAGGARDLVFPTMVDALVGGRLADEIAAIVGREDARTFTANTRADSLSPRGDYTTGAGTWLRFLDSLEGDGHLGLGIALRTDVREFYPSVDHTLARQILAQRTQARPEIIDLLMGCVEAWLAPGLRGRGLPLDNQDVGAVIAHAVLRNVDDLFPDTFEQTYRRFVDDTVIFSESREEAEAQAERLRVALRKTGLTLHPTKSTVLPAEALVRQFADKKAHARIKVARTSKAALWTMYSEFRNMKEGRQKHARIRHLLRFAREHRAKKSSIESVIDDLGVPDRDAANLEFLGSQALHQSALKHLLRTEGRGWREGERVRLLECLTRARLFAPEAVTSYAEAVLTRADAGNVEQSKAAVLLFKLHGPNHRALSTWRPTRRGGMASATQRVLARVCGFDAVASEHPDTRWADRLLDGVQYREIPVERVLGAVTWTKRSKVNAEHLPLLHLIDQVGAKEVLNEVCTWLIDSGDPALKQHGLWLRPKKPESPPTMTLSAWKVAFVHLVDDSASRFDSGELAKASGVKRKHLSKALRALEAAGFMRDLGSNGRRVVNRVDLWRAFEGQWRGTLAEDRYITQAASPGRELQEWLRDWMDRSPEGDLLGGQAAAQIAGLGIVAASAVVHVENWNGETMRSLGLVPAQSGPVLIRRRLTHVDSDPENPGLAHPILIRCELLLDPNPRLDNAKEKLARRIRETTP